MSDTRDAKNATRLIEQLWTIFRHDTLRRCKTLPEMIAAFRQFKSELQLKVNNPRHAYWLENTLAMLDLKIEELLKAGTKEGKARTKALTPPKPKKKGKMWLPKILQKTRIVPPEAN